MTDKGADMARKTCNIRGIFFGGYSSNLNNKTGESVARIIHPWTSLFMYLTWSGVYVIHHFKYQRLYLVLPQSGSFALGSCRQIFFSIDCASKGVTV